MRRLYYALPFLLIATGYVLWNVRITPGIIALFNWLTFFLELRYGGESKEGEELVAMSIAVSSLLGLGKGTLASIGEFLALFTFILELTA
ncbi:hypothetical protein [Thermococcus sp. JCM 11816]|uniref:hypothetical protein n=1 Tax=Thermococcus sp. (strain JCM 11816 / KS-1) TaxID=1295125 RepID=UPI0006D09396